MKKAFVCFVFLVFSSICLHSQTEKGRLIYGGSFGLGTSIPFGSGLPAYSGPRWDFYVSPQFGGFVAKNFAILAILKYHYLSGDMYYGAGPELRYYAGGEKIKFYAFANVVPGGNFDPHFAPGKAINRFNIGFSVGPGIAIFAKRNFSVHINLFFEQIGAYIQTGGIGTSIHGLLDPLPKKEKKVTINN